MWQVTRSTQKKLVVLLYTNDNEAERETRKTSPFTIATKSTKYVVVTLTKEVKVLFDKNVKSFKKEIEEDARKWMERINTVKMEILPKAMQKFNVINENPNTIYHRS